MQSAEGGKPQRELRGRGPRAGSPELQGGTTGGHLGHRAAGAAESREPGPWPWSEVLALRGGLGKQVLGQV